MFEHLLLKWIKSRLTEVTYFSMVYFCRAKNVGQKLFSQEIYEQDISTSYALTTK
jgi:hypothetical protein